ncbi:hypothetical protein GCM10009839_32310 [Catenulispora yoronensis]|uniref:DUF11 domain-containing protein n=1 Tax=Catenulispora yoronensis TaxID=450799 RepID=A0ABN2U6Y8_9ACTN
MFAACALGLSPASAAPLLPSSGSVLLDEPFTGTSVANPGFNPLQDACLTGATASAPPGSSTLGPCTGANQITPPVPTPGQLPGYLQLTDPSIFRVGSTLYNRPLPGNGGLQVTFKQYQYGGSGADGIGFFLVDGSTDLTSAGADGGSLGYAQRNGTNGVEGGYIGVGLDAFGNFANDSENRGLGCTGTEVSPVPQHTVVPNSVVLRGPGQGLNGYCFLAGTVTPDPANPPNYKTSLPGTLRADGTDPAASERTVRVTVSQDTYPMVTVEIDFEDGNGFQPVLSHQMTEPRPATYKLGFASSTGGATDTHLIRDAVASSLVTLDQLNLVKTVVDPAARTSARSTPSDTTYTGGTVYNAGDTVHYQFLVTNTGTTNLTDVVVTDPAATDITCPRTTLGFAGSPTAGMVCTGSHTITPADSQNGHFENTATAHGTAPETGAVTSNPSSSAVPVNASSPHLLLNKTTNTQTAHPGDKVTYTLTVTNHSGFTLTPATATDDLTTLLNSATYNGDAHASTGTISVTDKTLHWTGPLADGATATISYSVTIGAEAAVGSTLTNAVTSAVVGAECGSGSALPCSASVRIVRAVPPTPPQPVKPAKPAKPGPGKLPATGAAGLVPAGVLAVGLPVLGAVVYRRSR